MPEGRGGAHRPGGPAAAGWMESGGGLPFRAMRTDRPSGRGAGAAWASIVPSVEAARAVPGTDSLLHDQVVVWKLDDVLLTQASFGAARFRRSPARAAADGIRSLDFAVLVRGAWTGRTDGGGDIIAGPGEVVCLDFARAFQLTGTATECVVLSVARAALPGAAAVDGELHGHVFRGVGAALLIDHCLSLSRHVGQMRADEVPAVRGALLSQIAAAVSLMAPPADVRPRVRRIRDAARHHIDRHLGERELSAGHVRAALGVSRTSLYRAFQEQGGIDAFIQRRRLEAVHALLRLPDEARSIGELAQAFGFSRPSHLTTAFRRTFGYTPRNLRTTPDLSLAATSARGGPGATSTPAAPGAAVVEPPPGACPRASKG